MQYYFNHIRPTWVIFSLFLSWYPQMICQLMYHFKFCHQFFCFMAYLDRTYVGTGLGPGPIKFYCSRSSPHISCSMKIQHNTRMHSNRMRTARLLTVSQHALLGRGVPAWGCTCRGGVPAGGGVPFQGVYLPRGSVPARGVYLPRYSPL